MQTFQKGQSSVAFAFTIDRSTNTLKGGLKWMLFSESELSLCFLSTQKAVILFVFFLLQFVSCCKFQKKSHKNRLLLFWTRTFSQWIICSFAQKRDLKENLSFGLPHLHSCFYSSNSAEPLQFTFTLIPPPSAIPMKPIIAHLFILSTESFRIISVKRLAKAERIISDWKYDLFVPVLSNGKWCECQLTVW